MLLKGGPRTQIFQTKKGLEDLGVNVTLFESWQDFKKEDVDLIHLFGANIGTFHLAREIHKLGIPMVVSPIFFSRHTPAYIRSVSFVDGLVKKVALGAWTDYGIIADICRWSKAVLPNTAGEARLISLGLGVRRERITVIPNGVDARFSRATPELFKKTYGIENFVLNVGHIGPGRKNVLRLIQALENINVPSVIIGRIEDNEYGRTCVEKAKKNRRLIMIDSLPNDSELLASAYAACDVFVLPSLFETPGIAALEAALAGANIVITKHGGTEEYFGGHAEYVDPTSWELIHHGIVTALNKPKNSALRTHIMEQYLWPRVAEKTLEVYESILN
jgi:glycosyltransferase involved in cell wall biosynthesis